MSIPIGFLKKNALVLFLLILILIVGHTLRHYQYYQVPHPGDTDDEYSFAWVGLSLIEYGYPIAWSGIDGYKTHDYQRINVDHIFSDDPSRKDFPIDKPWFDHPPLFGLITGGFAYLKGAREFEKTTVFIIRKPMLIIGILTTILIFIFATQLYGQTTGLISALLYSIIPTSIISSRLALAENGYIPLFLISLILLNYFFKTKKGLFLFSALFFGSLAILFKLSAIFILISISLLLIIYGGKNRFKFFLYTLISILIPLLIFLLYGTYFNFDTFIKVFLSNSHRFYGAGPEIFYSVLAQPKIVSNHNLTDGWIILGWISLFIISFTGFKNDKQSIILTVITFSYFLIFLIFGSESYGWYRFPFLPILIISIAKTIQNLYNSNNIFLTLALFLLPFGTSVHRILGVENFQPFVPLTRIFILLTLSIFLGLIFKKNLFTKIYKVYFLILFLLLLLFSIQELYYLNYDHWFFIT